MAASAVLDLDIAEKRFGASPAPLFADLRFQVAPSSVLVLAGPSGIGKSSLLRMIAGIDRDFTGRIMVDGRAAHRAKPPGFVFQDPRLLPWLGAIANIRAVSPAISRTGAEDLLRQVGLGGFEHALPHQLSGGMQRRVALARALGSHPQLLLLDEPFLSLDPALTHELHHLFLRVIADYRPTVILVSHVAHDAARLGDRVLILGGKPAMIAADMHLDTPRAMRSLQEVAKIEHDLAERMEAAQREPTTAFPVGQPSWSAPSGSMDIP